MNVTNIPNQNINTYREQAPSAVLDKTHCAEDFFNVSLRTDISESNIIYLTKYSPKNKRLFSEVTSGSVRNLKEFCIFNKYEKQLLDIIKRAEKDANQEISENVKNFFLEIKNELDNNICIDNYIDCTYFICTSTLTKCLGYLKYSKDEEAVIVNWIFPDMRFGFIFDKDSENSGWYLVSNEKLGYLKAQGLFVEANIEIIIKFITYFILLYESEKS